MIAICIGLLIAALILDALRNHVNTVEYVTIIADYLAVPYYMFLLFKNKNSFKRQQNAWAKYRQNSVIGLTLKLLANA
jgi:hypothetical protein